MYLVDGSFGKVRTISHIPTQAARSMLNYVTSAGWHRCNDQYRICRDRGCDTCLLLLTMHGCGQLKACGNSFALDGASLAILGPDAPHEYTVPKGGEWEFYWLHFGGLQATAMVGHIIKNNGNVLTAGTNMPVIRHDIEQILLLKNAAKPGFEARASQIVSNILHDLLLALQDNTHGVEVKDGNTAKLIRYLEERYASAVSIEEASRCLYVSPAHLSRSFRQATGFTPYDYLKRYRIMKSKELLLYTDMGIKEIAEKTGFRYASNFIVQFKSIEPNTPGEFRKQAGPGWGGNRS